jgi:N-methylhydantoinase A
MVAFGGAGPLHAARLAAELHIPLTVVPPSPGITSALGLLATDLVHDYSRTLHRATMTLDLEEVEREFTSLQEEGRRVLEHDGVAPQAIAFRRYFEMRYAGQSFELSVPVPTTDWRDGQLQATETAFHREHQRAYGFAAPEEPTELVTVRVAAIGRMPRPRLRPVMKREGDPVPARTRQVYFAESGDFVPCNVFDRSDLGAGTRLVGPAIVEELDSTCAVHPGVTATVDTLGNLLLS